MMLSVYNKTDHIKISNFNIFKMVRKAIFDIMLTYFFNDIGSDSLYEHLYKCIKNDIEQGVLTSGTKLPSKRAFAKNLNISTITVENAYYQLISEGYIYSIPKKGYFVSNIDNSVDTADKQNERLYDSNQSEKEFLINFAGNHTNPDTFPFSIWTKLMREVITDLPNSLMKNSPAAGIYELREEIAKHLKTFRGMNVSADNIIIGAGTDYLYRLIIELLGYDKAYSLEDPGYKKLYKIYKGANVKCSFIPIDESGIIVDKLRESGADIVHISPSHHFPSGITTPISRRYEIIGWAAASKDRYIIEDDFDSEFRMEGKPIPSLQSIDVIEKVIYMNTFTKSLASTIRVSYMVLPSHLMKKFNEKMNFYSCTVSNFEQYTLLRFLKDGYFERHINRMRKHYRSLRDQLLTEIENSELSKSVSIAEENSGLHFLMKIDTDMTDEEIAKLGKQNNIKLAFLSEFYQNPTDDNMHTLVINYSGLKPEDIKTAVKLLSSCLK